MLRTVTGLFAAAAVAVAVTPITDDAMTQLLNEGGVSLAMKAQPMFFFGQAMNRPPCIPTWATSGNQQTPSSPLCDYPDMGCNCVTPDKGIGNPSQRFPIYYSYSRCSDTMVRVAYNLFYTKDGAKPKGINGHPYDWERVLVELRKSDDTQWRPYQLHLSQHSGYDRIRWPNVGKLTRISVEAAENWRRQREEEPRPPQGLRRVVQARQLPGPQHGLERPPLAVDQQRVSLAGLVVLSDAR